MWGRRKALQSQDCSIKWQGMCVQSREGGGRKGQEPSCLCFRSGSLYCSVSQWPQLSRGKPLLSKQLAVSLIFQQWLCFKQPCCATGMNFSPGRGHKCLPSYWNTGSPARAYSMHRHKHAATSGNQAAFRFCEKKNCRGLVSRKEAPMVWGLWLDLPGSWYRQIAWRILLPCLSFSALWLHTTSSHYMSAKSLWIHAQLDGKVEWGARDWLSFLFCKLALVHFTHGTWFSAFCMWAGAVKGNKHGNKKLNVRVDRIFFLI